MLREIYDEPVCAEANHDLKYLSLWSTLQDAWSQAAFGKGKDRHQKNDEPFEDQPICMFARRVGIGFPLGQAMKKIDEAARMEQEAAVNELLGAINYLAAAVIVLRELSETKPLTVDPPVPPGLMSIMGEK